MAPCNGGSRHIRHWVLLSSLCASKLWIADRVVGEDVLAADAVQSICNAEVLQRSRWLQGIHPIFAYVVVSFSAHIMFPCVLTHVVCLCRASDILRLSPEQGGDLGRCARGCKLGCSIGLHNGWVCHLHTSRFDVHLLYEMVGVVACLHSGDARHVCARLNPSRLQAQ